MKRKIKAGIIGFGRFGKLIAKYLSKDFNICFFDKKIKSANKNGIGRMEFNPLKLVCQSDIIIICVPISEFKKLLYQIKGFIKKDALIVDVCSVKEYPIKLMGRILPKNIQILATHPLFGPDTASNSLKDRKIVLCRVRISNRLYNNIKKFLRNKGLKIIEVSPEEHDKEIAKSLSLTHFIGRSLMEMKSSNVDIDTLGYKNLMEVLNTVKHDTWQLFLDMNHYNRFSEDVRKNFIKSAINVNRMLK